MELVISIDLTKIPSSEMRVWFLKKNSIILFDPYFKEVYTDLIVKLNGLFGLLGLKIESWNTTLKKIILELTYSKISSSGAHWIV